MTGKISRRIVEAYLHCKLKGHLLATGTNGIKSDYGAMLDEDQAVIERQATEKILTRHTPDHIVQNGLLTRSLLGQGPAFLLAATLETDLFSLAFDGLKRMVGDSRLGDFHYLPVLFHGGSKIGKKQRLLLELYGLLLFQLQGRSPERGVVYYGRECKASSVRLEANQHKARRILDELRELQSDETAPKLILNDHCQICEFRQRCHEQAVKEDHLSLLRGMGERDVKRLGRKGIFTLTQFAYTFRPRRKGKRVQRSKRRYHELQAMAIRDRRVYVFGTPELPSAPVNLYLDVESLPDEGCVYLIGLIASAGESEMQYSFWADSKDQEITILEEFLGVIARYNDYRVFCYGSHEKGFLTRMRSRAEGKKKQVDKVLTSLVNTLSVVYSHFYFPAYSNGLKDIGGCLGCTWDDENASGLQSIVWRRRWEECHEERWKQRIIGYNLEDCLALQRTTEFVRTITEGIRSESPTVIAGEGDPSVIRVEEIDRLANLRKWGVVNFVHGEYEYINKCAYFDYQRERIFVRTSSTIKRSVAKKRKQHGKHQNRQLRVSKRVEIESSRCPICKSTDLARGIKGAATGVAKPRVKRAIDLIVTHSGIKRRIIDYRAKVHQCRKCGIGFVPPQYERLDKHGHNLKSWAMYQHVAHRLSLKTIEEMLHEFFGVRVHDGELLMFKSLMARNYKTTYQRLLAKVRSGAVVHVDETEVKLRTGKGYVWVLASLEEVIYLYRPNREADFLRESLKEFHGVLVSDFFSAYDSFDCPQQKCLIHLMRDINHELLNNPYDEELQSITQPFGVLLRSVVATVDEHGLKHFHLKQHKREVSRFFDAITAQSLRSEAALSLRDRLVKHRNKLFTFLDYDGVPWNNNNAENAIKRFAYYRENTIGVMTEAGLSDYLVLLSMYQTCRYKGVSFFKFLLSRERDIDLFCEGRRKRRRIPAVEVYPQGFEPPHFATFRKGKGVEPQQKEGDGQSQQAGELHTH